MTWSRSPVCARPVRTLPRSFLRASSDFFILDSVFFFSSAIIMWPPASISDVHQCALILAGHYALQRTGLEDAEHVDRQLLVAAQGKCGRVHDLEVLPDGFVEADPAVSSRGGILVGVR